MTRSATPYASRDARQVNVAGSTSIAEPVAGFYRCRLRSGSVIGGVRLWFGQPADPVTGELMDRSLRWMAEFDGQPVDIADDDFLGTLNMDHLAFVEIIMIIEEELDIEILDDEVERFRPNQIGTTRPLSELVALIDAKKMDQAA